MYRGMEKKSNADARVNEKVNDKVNENDVLSLLIEQPEYTVTQLAEKLMVSRKTIANKLKILKEKEKIERIGSARKGYWKIKQ